MSENNEWRGGDSGCGWPLSPTAYPEALAELKRFRDWETAVQALVAAAADAAELFTCHMPEHSASKRVLYAAVARVRDFHLQPSAAPAAAEPSADDERMARAKEAADAEVKRHLREGRAVYGRRDGEPVWVQPAEPSAGDGGEYDLERDQLRADLNAARGHAADWKAERDKLRDDLEKALIRPEDPVCASDAERDVDYWRMKAGEHYTAYRAVADECDQLRERDAWSEREINAVAANCEHARDAARKAEAERDKLRAELADVRAAEAEAIFRVPVLHAERDQARAEVERLSKLLEPPDAAEEDAWQKVQCELASVRAERDRLRAERDQLREHVAALSSDATSDQARGKVGG